MARDDDNVTLDLNNAVFLDNLLSMEKDARNQAFDTLKKIRQLRWDQVYADKGLKWEKINSITPPKGIPTTYSLRINKSRRATAYRDGNVMRFLTIAPDHDATYGKK